MFVCLSVSPSHFLTPFNNLFATISQSPMSKLFRYSESLGKSNEKKWSQILTFLLKWSKIAAAKKAFKHIFSSFVNSIYWLFAATSQSPMSKPFRFSQSLGKEEWKERVSDLKTFAPQGAFSQTKN